MPNVAPATMSDIDKRQRSKLQKLAFERAVIGYTFSYDQLFKLLCKLDTSADAEEVNTMLLGCIVAMNEEERKALTEKYTEELTVIFSENGLIQINAAGKPSATLRFRDPFGFEKDFSMYQGTAVSFDKDTAMQWGVSHGIPAEKFNNMMAAGRKEKTYVTIAVKSVKEKE